MMHTATLDGISAFSVFSGLEVEDVMVRAGGDVRVEIEVDRTRELTPERVVVETSWRIVDGVGETLARLRADVVCRRSRDVARAALPELFVRDPLAAEFECVDNIPI